MIDKKKLYCTKCNKRRDFKPIDDNLYTYAWYCTICDSVFENKKTKLDCLSTRLKSNLPMTREELFFLKKCCPGNHNNTSNLKNSLDKRIEIELKKNPFIIESQLITNQKISQKKIDKLTLDEKSKKEGKKIFNVYRVIYKGKEFFACWSNGFIEKNDWKLSPAGECAIDALLNIEKKSDDAIFVISEIKLNKNPLYQQIYNIFESIPEHSKVAFVGDLKNELDGHMMINFNVNSLVHIK